MVKITVAVIFGGCSEEHKISLKSAHNILTNLDSAKYDVVMIGITKTGRWLKYSGPVDLILADRWLDSALCTPIIFAPNRDIHGFIELQQEPPNLTKVDVAFPVLHGKYGEDGCIQGLFELAGIPYVGCGVASSVLCMDKAAAHQNVAAAGVRVTPSIVLTAEQKLDSEDLALLQYPLFVKPAGSGSSFGVTKVNLPSELAAAISEARLFDSKILIEQGVSGCEVGCAVLGCGNDLVTGEVDQIELTHGLFRIHQEQAPEVASENSTIQVPAPLSAEITAEIKAAACLVYRALGCSGLARVDMFLTPENQVVFNEVNSMPGFTSYSRYPRMMAAAGLSIGAIIDRVITLALN